MAERVRARLTAAEGRKFGLTLGIAFLMVGALLFWRHKPVRAEVVGGVGALLMLAALIAPTALGPLERAWMGLAHAISKVTTPIFMGVVYFLVITPIAFIRRAMGKGSMTSGVRAGWSPHHASHDRERMERQF